MRVGTDRAVRPRVGDLAIVRFHNKGAPSDEQVCLVLEGDSADRELTLYKILIWSRTGPEGCTTHVQTAALPPCRLIAAKIKNPIIGQFNLVQLTCDDVEAIYTSPPK